MYKPTTTIQSTSYRESVIIMDGLMRIKIPIKDILYIQAEHVYIRIRLVNNQQILHRISLANFLKQLPSSSFVQVHRSYVINIDHVSWWNAETIGINGTKVPLSRSRRKMVNQLLLTKSKC